MIIVDSPRNGPYSYEWDPKSELWISNTHSHFLEGYLVNEFLRITNGYIDFDGANKFQS